MNSKDEQILLLEEKNNVNTEKISLLRTKIKEKQK